jgi:hypothetical protein
VIVAVVCPEVRRNLQSAHHLADNRTLKGVQDGCRLAQEWVAGSGSRGCVPRIQWGLGFEFGGGRKESGVGCVYAWTTSKARGQCVRRMRPCGIVKHPFMPISYGMKKEVARVASVVRRGSSRARSYLECGGASREVYYGVTQ